jgi:hypothetical protein
VPVCSVAPLKSVVWLLGSVLIVVLQLHQPLKS